MESRDDIRNAAPRFDRDAPPDPDAARAYGPDALPDPDAPPPFGPGAPPGGGPDGTSAAPLGGAADPAAALESADAIARVRRALADSTPITWFLAVAFIACFAWLLSLHAEAIGVPFSGRLLGDAIPKPVLAAWGAATPGWAADGEWWRAALCAFAHEHLLQLVLYLLILPGLARATERLVGAGGLLAAFFSGTAAWAAAGSAAGEMVAGPIAGLLAAWAVLPTAVRGADVPAAFRRALRRRFLGGLAFLGGIELLFRYGVPDVPVRIVGWHLVGLPAGLAVGLVAHARIRAPDPFAQTRSRFALGAIAGAGLLLAAYGTRHALDAGRAVVDPDLARRAAIAAMRLERVEVAPFGLSLHLPIGWERVRLGDKESKHVAAFRPREGGAVVQVVSVPNGGLGVPMASPELVLDELRREHGRAGEVIAAPFRSERVAGIPATRLLVRYRVSGRQAEDVRYFVNGPTRLVILQVVGSPRFAEALGEAIARTAEIRNP